MVTVGKSKLADSTHPFPDYLKALRTVMDLPACSQQPEPHSEITPTIPLISTFRIKYMTPLLITTLAAEITEERITVVADAAAIAQLLCDVIGQGKSQ